MNPAPHLHHVEIQNTSCGRQALRNREVAFWQSRMTVDGQRAEPPNLVDLAALARKLRSTYRLAA